VASENSTASALTAAAATAPAMYSPSDSRSAGEAFSSATTRRLNRIWLPGSTRATVGPQRGDVQVRAGHQRGRGGGTAVSRLVAHLGTMTTWPPVGMAGVVVIVPAILTVTNWP
jgi:hypothetical protein